MKQISMKPFKWLEYIEGKAEIQDFLQLKNNKRPRDIEALLGHLLGRNKLGLWLLAMKLATYVAEVTHIYVTSARES